MWTFFRVEPREIDYFAEPHIRYQTREWILYMSCNNQQNGMFFWLHICYLCFFSVRVSPIMLKNALKNKNHSFDRHDINLSREKFPFWQKESIGKHRHNSYPLHQISYLLLCVSIRTIKGFSVKVMDFDPRKERCFADNVRKWNVCLHIEMFVMLLKKWEKMKRRKDFFAEVYFHYHQLITMIRTNLS